MSSETFIARQPIFDHRLEVRGYELLHRSGWTNAFDGRDPDRATVELLHGSLLVNRLEDLTNGLPGYVNVPRNLLVQDLIELLPAELTVIEVLETVEPEPEVLEALARLRRHGYTIALDDFVDGPGYEALVALADIIKVDFLQTDPGARSALVRRHARPGLRFLAEKVETREEFEHARAMGFELFQGYFFCKPETTSRRSLSSDRLASVQFLREITRPALELSRIASVIRSDPALTSKLLHYLNSARFGVRAEIRSIKQALVHLGERPLRRWATVVAMAGLGKDKPLELVRTCLVRARFCESLAGQAQLDEVELDLYLVGMFSAVDALLDRPLAEALDELALGEKIGSALFGDDSQLSRARELALACERGDWRGHAALATGLGLDPERVAELYAEALFWADDVFGSAAAA